MNGKYGLRRNLWLYTAKYSEPPSKLRSGKNIYNAEHLSRYPVRERLLVHYETLAKGNGSLDYGSSRRSSARRHTGCICHSIADKAVERANDHYVLFPGFGKYDNMWERRHNCKVMFEPLIVFSVNTSVVKFLGETDLLSKIIGTRNTSCRLQHDRVFAVRRLANVQHVELLRPNYKMAIGELWKRVAVVELSSPSGWVEGYMIKFSSSVLILALAGVQRQLENSAGPSWLPDLSLLAAECLRKEMLYNQS